MTSQLEKIREECERRAFGLAFVRRPQGQMASVFEIVLCLNCGLPAKLMSVLPSLKDDIDEITYRCPICDKDFKREVRAKSMNGPR
jgi:hypothetical protein